MFNERFVKLMSFTLKCTQGLGMRYLLLSCYKNEWLVVRVSIKNRSTSLLTGAQIHIQGCNFGLKSGVQIRALSGSETRGRIIWRKYPLPSDSGV